MAKPKLADIRDEAESIYATYNSNFAGKPRATRDPNLLADLVERLETLISDARTLLNGSRNPAVLAIIETATENLERYHEEKKAIENASGDPHSVYAARLADRANRVFDQYGRHFAGEDRGTRDRRLLEELVGDLRRLEASLARVAERGVSSASGDLETVRAQLQLYEDEVGNIRAAQRAGTPEERANRLAQLANAQFDVYRNHFAGKSRTSRRPGLAARMIANLEEYQQHMRQIERSGFTSQQNQNNIQIIEQNLQLYRSELIEIEKARDEVSVNDLVGVLGGAANEVMAEYRENFAGKDRKTRNIGLLGVLCDQMSELARQMGEISDEIEIEANENNLHIVEENWATYEREYGRIAEAQGIA